MGVAFVRRELVEVAEIDRFNGRRKKAEYVEPVCQREERVSRPARALLRLTY